MMRKYFLLILCVVLSGLGYGQGEAPNYSYAAASSPGTAQSAKLSSTDVNLFTGMPNVSVPIYTYKSNNGMALSVSLNYIGGGGIQVGEMPTMTGLGWALSAGGSISRTVRGMPDDVPVYGFINSGAIPNDFRDSGYKLYHDYKDAQQDVFHFNFPGHSGKFFIGKNKQVIVVPYSKMKVIPRFNNSNKISSFRVVAENGVKYDFEEVEYTTYAISLSTFPPGYSPTPSGNYQLQHATSWQLTRIVSPFNSDTIRFNYTAKFLEYGFTLPQVTFVQNSNGARKTPRIAPGYGSANTHKLSSIELPDNTTVSFIYSNTIRYSTDDYALEKIKISDTAFRMGYLLEYQQSYGTANTKNKRLSYDTIQIATRLLLKGVVPYTSKQRQPGHYFDYNYPLFPSTVDVEDSFYNRKDHWGFYNGQLNGDSLIPQVNGYSWGANREPSVVLASSNALTAYWLPTGGVINYSYELNDHYPYYKQEYTVSISPPTGSQNTINLNQVFNPKHQLSFYLDRSVTRIGGAPISGGGVLNIYIKSSDGVTLYLSGSISLYDLFYTGLRTWSFNLPNGTYRLETSISSGTSISGSFPIDIKWENKTADLTRNYEYCGGIRVVRASKHNTQTGGYGGTMELYKYVREDGRSSGFLGDVPRYHYPYRQIAVNGGTTITDYTTVSSEPVGTQDVSHAGRVGYSRVEIIRTSYPTDTLGKEVQEYTDLQDVNSNVFADNFPYTPQDIRDWGLGLPKRISLYDTLGNLVRRTVNTYQFDTIVYDNDNFKSLKLGNHLTTYTGDPDLLTTPKVKEYLGQHYYLTNGKAFMVATKDSLYHSNSTVSATSQQLQYDTNYNVVKVVIDFDKTRSLYKEQRMYYPYHYTIGGAIGKLRDSGFITQPVSTETWITGDSDPRIASGTITSYKQISSGEIKPDSMYSFESNKPISQSTITVFNAGVLNRNTTWFKPQTQFLSYNDEGNLIETKNLVTGQHHSLIIDHAQQYTLAKVSNAAQVDIAYTSFEGTGTGNWTVASTTRSTDKINGKRSYNLSSGNISKSGLTSSKKYILSLWLKDGASVSVNSTALSGAIATQQGWSLYSLTLTGISSVTISGSGFIDELRLHPWEANMVTNTYEPMIGITSITDANNTMLYNEYDGLHRLGVVRDKDLNIVKRFQYEDSAMLINLSPNWVLTATGCNANSPGVVDSTFIDNNQFSDSTGYSKTTIKSGLDCNCPGTNTPQYKIVYGNCEMGTWAVVGSVYKKINNVFQWECTHRYCFTDGSQSTYYELSYHSTSCSNTCFIPL